MHSQRRLSRAGQRTGWSRRRHGRFGGIAGGSRSWIFERGRPCSDRLADETLGQNFDQLINSLIRFSKPLLAAVHGAAVGFGATILLHCDLTLVAETARLRLPFTALGTTPEAASSFLLPQIVGAQRAADLILTSRWISGREAAQMGLAARCCPEESLHSEALATAQALTALPDVALATAKRLLKAGTATLVQDALRRERSEAGMLHRSVGPMEYRANT